MKWQKFTFLARKISPNILVWSALAAFIIFFTGSAFAQESKTVTGRIISNTGEQLIGVNVILKGTTTGTVTDVDGTFSIRATSEDVLVISYTGFVTQEATVGNQTSFSITLLEDTELLDEVVVIGYGTQKKSDLTGSVNVVEVEEAKKTVTLRCCKNVTGSGSKLNRTVLR